ncbi:MAG: LacI family DNA-binding transcriptional regulator [Kiritimatiellae bacterium]|nr:LacI family DNA-binding transcriptional regulator [Kiritimatiellia bacterium]
MKLARLCGVSQGTVDRALHNRAGISAATRQRVLAAAQRHGYRPHPAASELLRGQSCLAGAVLPAGGGVFFLDLIEAIRRALRATGWRLLVSLADGETEFRDAVADFAARRVRGLVVVPPRDGFPLDPRETGGLPVVSLLGPCEGVNTHWITPDETAAGRQATSYLWRQGHRRILHFTYARDAYAIRARADGYADCMRRHGAQVQVHRGSGLADAVRRHGATAIFCHNDWLALTAMRRLSRAGLRVPEDVSVLGVDDTPTFRELCGEITTLQYPLPAVAEACRAVLAGRPPRQPRDVGRFTLVARQTVVPVSAELEGKSLY